MAEGEYRRKLHPLRIRKKYMTGRRCGHPHSIKQENFASLFPFPAVSRFKIGKYTGFGLILSNWPVFPCQLERSSLYHCLFHSLAESVSHSIGSKGEGKSKWDSKRAIDWRGANLFYSCLWKAYRTYSRQPPLVFKLIALECLLTYWIYRAKHIYSFSFIGLLAGSIAFPLSRRLR